MNTIKSIKVRRIISSDIGGYSRVTVDNELFNAIRGVKPALPYKGMGDAGGNGIRAFTIGGIFLYSHYNKNDGKNEFFMRTQDAQKNLKPLDEERANEEKLPFNVSAFATNISLS